MSLCLWGLNPYSGLIRWLLVTHKSWLGAACWPSSKAHVICPGFVWKLGRTPNSQSRGNDFPPPGWQFCFPCHAALFVNWSEQKKISALFGSCWSEPMDSPSPTPSLPSDVFTFFFVFQNSRLHTINCPTLFFGGLFRHQIEDLPSPPMVLPSRRDGRSWRNFLGQWSAWNLASVGWMWPCPGRRWKTSFRRRAGPEKCLVAGCCWILGWLDMIGGIKMEIYEVVCFNCF